MMKIPARISVFASSGLILVLFIFMALLFCASLSGGVDRTGGPGWISIATGKSHSLAVKFNGTLWAWGGNEVGQLGDGTIRMRHTPVQIGQGKQWTSAVAGYFHTIALQSDGSLWTWGLNEYGELGDGTTEERYLPVQIGRLD